MTDYNEKVRALFLTALMVFSVFAGTVALSGTAAAGVASATITTGEDVTPDSANNADEVRLTLSSGALSDATDTANFEVSLQPLIDAGVSDVDEDSLTVTTTSAPADDTVSGLTFHPGNNTVTANVTDAGDGSGNPADSDIESFTIGISGFDASGVQDTDVTMSVNVLDQSDRSGTTASDTTTVHVDNTAPGIQSANAFDNEYTDTKSIIGSTGATTGTDAVLKAGADVGTVTVDEDETIVELVFNESIATVGDTGGTGPDVGDFRVNLTDGTSVQPDALFDKGGADGQLYLVLDSTDVKSVSGVNVTDNGGAADFTDDDGNVVQSAANQGVGIGNTASTSLADNGGDYSGTSKIAYSGETIAYVVDSNDADFEINTAAGKFIFSGSTGTNSQVYFWDSADRNLSATYQFDGPGAIQDLGLRNLQLSASVDATEIQTDESLSGEITSRVGNRDVDVTITDSDDNTQTKTYTLDGSGEATFSFDGLEADTYSVEVVDVNTGVTDTTDDVTVSDVPEGSADFGGVSVFEEDRGDVVEIPINIEGGTDTATVNIGSDSAGFNATVQVTDGNNDGEVTLLWNTVQETAQTSLSTASTPDGEDPDTVTVVRNPTHEINGDDDVDVYDTGNYELDVRSGTDGYAQSQAVATISLDGHETTAISTWTAPSGVSAGSVDAIEARLGVNITQDSTIAQGDQLIYAIEATGLEGAMDQAGADDDNTTQRFLKAGNQGWFELNLTQTNPGQNAAPKVTNLDAMFNSLAYDEISVVADETEGQTDTYYVVIDTANLDTYRDNDRNGWNVGGNDVATSTSDPAVDDEFNTTFTVPETTGGLAMAGTETLSGEFSVDGASATVDYTGQDERLVRNEVNQTISGTTTLAVGSEISLRVNSQSDTDPFLK
uniref:DUF7827 domain-containing protein n=1 Tax=Halorhabdus sp. CUG00001 TaxID=2600297 RepID=UPI00131B9681